MAGSRGAGRWAVADLLLQANLFFYPVFGAIGRESDAGSRASRVIRSSSHAHAGSAPTFLRNAPKDYALQRASVLAAEPDSAAEPVQVCLHAIGVLYHPSATLLFLTLSARSSICRELFDRGRAHP
jgi:hypothetical protein